MPDAFHDSSARDPPPKCHPGTRHEYISTIMEWGLQSDKRPGGILWMKGPAGVGKSAIAQTCAEAFGTKLGAAFFFSEFNNRRNANCLFPSISYQLAVRLDAFGDIVDHKTHRDPTLVQKAPKHQFQELIVAPLRELACRGEDVGELVIIVDGLDECAGHDAQCNIINIIAESVWDQTTPLIWAFFSRPEAHITAIFTSPQVSPLSFRMELPISDRTDAEIAMYLTDELGKVRQTYGLPASWPSEQDIKTLVQRSAGLFIYAAAVARFVGDRNSLSPEDQLQFVLTLRRPVLGNWKYPLSELDSFYTLIMRRVPPDILPTARKILLATTFTRVSTSAIGIADLLGLTKSQFRTACRGLHSVLELNNIRINFFHASFMEFMQDPERSGDLYIGSDCAMVLRSELLDKLGRVLATSSSMSDVYIPLARPAPGGWNAFCDLVPSLFRLCQTVPLDTQTLVGLSKLDYAKLNQLYTGFYIAAENLTADILMKKVPEEFQRKIIYPYPHSYLFRSGQLNPPMNTVGQPYVLGQGKKKALCWRKSEGNSIFGPYPRLCRATIFMLFLKDKIAGRRGGGMNRSDAKKA